MGTGADATALEALLDAWDRHNTVLLNLLALIPAGALTSRAHPTSPTIAQMFHHLHHERLVSVQESAPEHAGATPAVEWNADADAAVIAALLKESGQRVRAAVAARIHSGRQLDLNFNHPAQLLAFLIFHDSYHHGQIKLALKTAGVPLDDDQAGPLIWDVWRARH